MGSTTMKNVRKNMHYITNYYRKLTTYTRKNQAIGSINEWIVDNYYLLSEQEQTINHELSSEKILKIKPKRKQYLDELIANYFANENYKLDVNLLFSYLNNYQKERGDYFSYDEIDYINSALKCNIISKLKSLSEIISRKFDDKEKIDHCFKKVTKLMALNKKIDFNKCMPLNSELLGSPFKILEINHRINGLGEFSEEAFVKLNEFLEKNNTSLKEIIKLEHEERTSESVLMVNLISSFKSLIKFKLEDLYAQISYVEKALINEKVGIYDRMYEVSKIEYRKKIKTLVRKKRTTEYQFIKEMLEKAGNEHVGFHLFPEKNYNLRAIIYVFGIVFLTVSLSALGGLYLGWFAFFLLLMPICGFLVEIITQILMKKVDTQTLFRIKLENHLPKEYSSMVVIPTILKDPQKVNNMFDNLELYYLSNRAENLYFCLLGDVTSEKTAKTKMDDKILSAGLNRANKLNEKYGKKIFHFVYRNRFFNEKEDCYLGYERKRGALQHFNQLLLGQMNKALQQKNFKGHSLENFKVPIKYVITLDADTKLLLNTALKLIGTMVHPMNQPVLSDDETRVVKGHAIMQPRVSIDVEVTNKSEYSQLFAGLGGLDIYSTKQFDLYQDIFGEGSFTGKGIYDLEIFEKLLNNTFPENLILSHDLIEGNYLRCGYISDVELFDGFPSKYLNDAMRHHRWTRGDWQIVGWLKKYVRNFRNDLVINPLNLISKWKIFDNLRRSLRSPALLLLVLYAFVCSSYPMITLWLVFIIITIPIFFYLFHHVLSRQKYDFFLRYYLQIIWGIFAVIAKAIIVFALLPYETYLYLDAIFKSLYRMNISKKNLLNWVTAEEVEATSKNTLGNYLRNFRPNYLAALIIILLAWFVSPEYFHLAAFVAIIWLIAPFLMFLVSRDITYQQDIPGKRMESDIREIANQTWVFFSKYLNKNYNFLIPDNYQENRNLKIDSRTSPTNIGFSLISIISAYELKIINEGMAIDKITQVIKSVDRLKKWNGHLYNWYDVQKMKELPPFFISTADSGNFVSSLYVVKGFLDKFDYYYGLKYRVNRLIDNTDFSKLYNPDNDAFSIGYIVNEGMLVPHHYNNFLSEARLASFLAIAKGDVPFKHWFRLDKTLTKHKWYKGVVSWTGTMFEYYMPLIFMKTYEHTLLDETYAFAYYAHKEFVREVDSRLPWGISESAYNKLDDSQNYKYKAFGIPYLKFHDSEIPKIVIAPYGSIMALGKYPMEVYNNMKKLKKLGMQGPYGFYESYDHDDTAVVKAYYSHHQGMILASITNYLKNNVIQEYFHTDKKIKSVEILLKEKVQIRTYIDLKIARYKKYNYKRDVYENDIRDQEGVMDIPETGILSNGSYAIFLNDRGLGFSKYKNLQVNRHRRMCDENHGIFVYVKNKNNNHAWSNTYNPTLQKPEYYHVVFASDRIKYVREDEGIITTTEVMVTKDHNAEIRKIKVENTTSEAIDLELTSYGEVIMARPEEDIAHQAFNSVTINCYVDEITSSLIFTRRSRTKEKTKYFIINRFFTEEDDGIFEYETSRLNFIGRNNSTINAKKIMRNEKLSCNANKLLDPIMSIRKNILLEPGDKKTYYLIVGFGKSEEQVLEIVNTYKNDRQIDLAFEKTTILNNMKNRYAGLSGAEISSYNRMLKYIYQPVSEAGRKDLLLNNVLTKESLWKFGISGDLPIILVDVYSAENSGFINDILKAYEFYQGRAIYIDVVIVNNEVPEKKALVQKSIDRIMYRINSLNYFDNIPGNVFVLDEINDEERRLFRVVASLYFNGSLRKSLNEQIIDFEQFREVIFKLGMKEDMKVIGEKGSECNFGKFLGDGKEFLIKTSETPMPWSNVLTNENFGTVITNNFGGFTYAYNSREFKITAWSNDSVRDPISEAIYIDDQRLLPSEVTNGFGYSVFKTKTKEYQIETTVFVPFDDNIKIYDININSENKKTCNVEFNIRPVLGDSEENTSRYIHSSFDKKNNLLVLQNTFNQKFKNEKIFVSCSEEILVVDVEDYNSRSIKTKLNLKEKQRIVIMLGCDNSGDLAKKYSQYANVDKALVDTKKYWTDKVAKLQITTPDESLNNMMNGWLLYQVYASRLYSKAAFYQVGGATGFRDQLQDVLCLLYTNPEYARGQILKQANHQFPEGDVLHWWHEEVSFGARTRFADDYLWLIYVVYEYLQVTNDYSILEEKVGFVEGEKLLENESEKGIIYTYSAMKESLHYHMKLAITRALSLMGKRGLPLMGSGDWNDGMNKVGYLGKGESVWMGFFLYDILQKYSEISRDDELNEKCLNEAARLKEVLNEKGWDGSWYLRAFFDDGKPLGSHLNSECQIDLISQSWSILTEIANENRTKKIINEVERNLVDKKAGIIKLLTPPFTGKGNNPGYISDYLPGIRENGAQYTHAALWYIMALAKIGDNEKAYQHFSMINPINKKPEVYKIEPYVISADVYSNQCFKGQGGWSWYTGSASWAYKIILEELLGIRKIGNQLLIKPKFPIDWGKISLKYYYLETMYELEIHYNEKEQIIELENDQKKHHHVIK